MIASRALWRAAAAALCLAALSVGYWQRHFFSAALLPALTGDGADNLPTPGPTAEVTGDTALVVGDGEVDVEGGVLALSPALPGVVREIPVKEGERVRPGAVLVALQDGVAAAQVRQATAVMRQAEVRLALAKDACEKRRCALEQQDQAIAAARARLEVQRSQIAKADRRFRLDLVNEEEGRSARNLAKALEAALEAEKIRRRLLALDDPEKAVALALASLEEARAAASIAREQCARHRLTAPVAGLVLRLTVGPGEAVGPAGPVPAVRLLPDGPWVVRCEVEQEFALRLRVGMTCDIYNDRLTAPQWRGRVLRVSDWIGPSRARADDLLGRQEKHTRGCVIGIDGDRAGLVIGQRVRVAIRAEGRGEGARPSGEVK